MQSHPDSLVHIPDNLLFVRVPGDRSISKCGLASDETASTSTVGPYLCQKSTASIMPSPSRIDFMFFGVYGLCFSPKRTVQIFTEKTTACCVLSDVLTYALTPVSGLSA